MFSREDFIADIDAINIAGLLAGHLAEGFSEHLFTDTLLSYYSSSLDCRKEGLINNIIGNTGVPSIEILADTIYDKLSHPNIPPMTQDGSIDMLLLTP